MAKMIQFVRTVKEMRTEQKNYFATRKKKHLFKSKELERKVDELLEQIDLKQLKLFTDEEH
jgi:hypothetical protein